MKAPHQDAALFILALVCVMHVPWLALSAPQGVTGTGGGSPQAALKIEEQDYYDDYYYYYDDDDAGISNRDYDDSDSSSESDEDSRTPRRIVLDRPQTIVVREASPIPPPPLLPPPPTGENVSLNFQSRDGRSEDGQCNQASSRSGRMLGSKGQSKRGKRVVVVRRRRVSPGRVGRNRGFVQRRRIANGHRTRSGRGLVRRRGVRNGRRLRRLPENTSPSRGGRATSQQRTTDISINKNPFRCIRIRNPDGATTTSGKTRISFKCRRVGDRNSRGLSGRSRGSLGSRTKFSARIGKIGGKKRRRGRNLTAISRLADVRTSGVRTSSSRDPLFVLRGNRVRTNQGSDSTSEEQDDYYDDYDDSNDADNSSADRNDDVGDDYSSDYYDD